MFPALNIGSFVFPTAALTYIIGAMLTLTAVEQAAKRLQQPPAPYYNLASTSLLAGIIGARLTFVFLNWPAYQQNLLGILWPINTGFNIWGGLLIGATAAIYYGRFRRLSLLPTLDILAPMLLIALLIISLADFLGGPGFGKLTTMPWGVNQFGVRRHPVQLYEIFISLIALVAWWRMARQPQYHGQLFLIATSLYSAGRLFVDAYRANAWLTTSGWHILQIICLGVLLTAVYIQAQQTPTASTPE